MNRFLTVTVLSVLSSISFSQAPTNLPNVEISADDVHNFIVFKQRAFYVGPALLVAGPSVSSPVWSTTGRYLAYDRIAPPNSVVEVQDAVQTRTPTAPETGIYLYSVVTGASAQVLRFGPGALVSDQVQWMVGSDKGFITTLTTGISGSGIRQSDWRLYMLDAENAAAQEFSPWEGSDKPEDFQVACSPTKPYAFLWCRMAHDSFTRDGKPERTYTQQIVLVGPNGSYVPIKFPEGTTNGLVAWSQDGTHAYLLSRGRVEGKNRSQFHEVLLDSGELKEIPRQTDFFSGIEPSGVLSIRDLSEPSTNGRSTATINALWLETADPDSQNRLLLAGDATSGLVNRSMDCASYISQGALFVRPISELPKSRFDEALLVYQHTQVMQGARQSGLALIMYAADYEDVLPNNRENLLAILGPYMKDPSMLLNFVYTYPGGPLTAMANPAETQIGYVDGTDGRAIVYGDGHTVWRPKL